MPGRAVRSWAVRPSLPPVAQGSFQAAQRRVNQALALVVGAAGVHPAQAGVVEEAQVAPQGEVVAVAPAAADHLGQGCHRSLSRLPPHSARLIARVMPGQRLVGHPAGGALGDEVQVGQDRGSHPVPGRRSLRQGVVGPPGALGQVVGSAPEHLGVKAGLPSEVLVHQRLRGLRLRSDLDQRDLLIRATREGPPRRGQDQLAALSRIHAQAGALVGTGRHLDMLTGAAAPLEA